jgi:hypothetical protein
LPRTFDPCCRPFRVVSPVALALVLSALAASALVPAAVAAPAAEPDPFKPVYGRKGESSVGILFGVGWYDNADINAALTEIGVEPIETGFEYGVQYRRRLSRYVSLGAELMRLDGRSTTIEGGGGAEFGIAGTPLFIDAFVHPLQVGGASLTLFAGGGPVFAVRVSQTYPDGYIVEGKKTSFGWHAGAEGEARFGENFGFFIRGLTRHAGADDIILSSDPTLEPVRFDVDFNGPAVTFGPVWHWGGQGAGAP